MEINFTESAKAHGSTMLNTTSSNEKLCKKENEDYTKTKQTESCVVEEENNRDDIELLANLPKAEVKLKKLNEAKFLIDKNENSLNVDTLIEMLSSSQNVTNSTPSATDDSMQHQASISSVLDSLTSSSSSSPKPSVSNSSSPNSSNIIITPHKKKFPSPINGGKPMIADLNKKMKLIGKRQSKQRAVVYQSQISDNSVGIKLCIKKSVNTFKAMSSSTSNNILNNKSSRKRSRKTTKSSSSSLKMKGSDSDDPYVKRRKKTSNDSNNSSSSTKVSFDEPIEQSVWGRALPKEVLLEIFKMVVKDEGSIPTACRLTRVCSLWRQVALDKKLWRNIDLSTYFKEKNRTELRLKWFIENRMIGSEEINISYWKVTNTLCVLIKLFESCPGLRSISLSGWRALSIDDLNYLSENFKKLSKLDLSSINTEMNTSKTAVGLQSLVNAIEKINEQLTHLNLADNRLSGIPQITQALTTHCPNLILLDLSNVKTIAVSHGMLHIEKLQEGCQKLKVLRLANSHVQLSSASLQEQMCSPGFPDLEELSVASLQDESRLMSDEALQRILKSSTKLKLLDVRGCARLTHDSLIRIPAWDLKHLFLSGSSVTRDSGSGLELISSKWAHSLIEFDLAWATMQVPLDNALRALADKRDESPLNHLNLCGSAVSVDAVKEILENCKYLNSINLSSCRGLPRGIKREHNTKSELKELLSNLRNEN